MDVDNVNKLFVLSGSTGDNQVCSGWSWQFSSFFKNSEIAKKPKLCNEVHDWQDWCQNWVCGFRKFVFGFAIKDKYCIYHHQMSRNIKNVLCVSIPSNQKLVTTKWEEIFVDVKVSEILSRLYFREKPWLSHKSEDSWPSRPLPSHGPPYQVWYKFVGLPQIFFWGYDKIFSAKFNIIMICGS